MNRGELIAALKNFRDVQGIKILIKEFSSYMRFASDIEGELEKMIPIIILLDLKPYTRHTASVTFPYTARYTYP